MSILKENYIEILNFHDNSKRIQGITVIIIKQQKEFFTFLLINICIKLYSNSYQNNKKVQLFKWKTKSMFFGN